MAIGDPVERGWPPPGQGLPCEEQSILNVRLFLRSAGRLLIAHAPLRSILTDRLSIFELIRTLGTPGCLKILKAEIEREGNRVLFRSSGGIRLIDNALFSIGLDPLPPATLNRFHGTDFLGDSRRPF